MVRTLQPAKKVGLIGIGKEPSSEDAAIEGSMPGDTEGS